MKKIILSLVLCLIFSATISIDANAKLANSKTSGSLLYGKSEFIWYYNKPGGKKIGEVKWRKIDYEKYHAQGPKPAIVIKFINENWIKVKFQIKANSLKYNYAYIKNDKNLSSVSFHGFDDPVVRVKSLNLRAKPSVNSKSLTKIPLGTVVNFHFPNKGSVQKNKWLKVTYVKNHKKYVGYVNKKHLIFL